MEKDMTKGSPMKLILGFAVPLLFGLVFQQFYSMMDAVIVGHYLGVDALAAVGATGSVNFLIIGFCMGVCNGFAIPIAQEFGAKHEENLRRFVANSVWLSVIFSVVITVIVSLLCRPILQLMRTPENIIDGSYRYIILIFLGIPVVFLYNMTAAILRSLGDSRTPVVFLVTASLLNIVLDVFCIVVLHMDVEGAAIATVVSQAVAGFACLIYMRKKFSILKLSEDERRWNRNYAAKLCNMGIPMGLQYSITAIGSVILQSAVNSIDSNAVAAVTAGGKVSMLLICPFDAMGSTMATYGGQNVGAGNLERVDKGLKSCSLLGLIYSLIALAAVWLFGKQLLLLFLDAGEAQIIANAYSFLRINALFYFPLALVNIIRFLIQGMGFSRLAVFAGAFEMLARGLAGFLLVPQFGFSAVRFANPLAWIFADIFLIPAFFHVRKKLAGILSKKREDARNAGDEAQAV
ncbi:MAG: MATE family efflux transporter [Bacteroidales bacterium]|nr:MATE family efflux transporter [Bacteroidales bacterium]MCM1415017.1 MATE family efflux transporter [bacterium]MCM1422871.1 MATE family efflux transporter [bacterium]